MQTLLTYTNQLLKIRKDWATLVEVANVRMSISAARIGEKLLFSCSWQQYIRYCIVTYIQGVSNPLHPLRVVNLPLAKWPKRRDGIFNVVRLNFSTIPFPKNDNIDNFGLSQKAFKVKFIMNGIYLSAKYVFHALLTECSNACSQSWTWRLWLNEFQS